MSKEYDKDYRCEFRSHFMNKINYKMNHPKHHTDLNIPGEASHNFRGQCKRDVAQLPMYDTSSSKTAERQRRHQEDLARSCGGDADRYLYDATHYAPQNIGDSYRDRYAGRFSQSQFQGSNKTAMPTNEHNATGQHYQDIAQMSMSKQAIDKYEGDRFRYETASNVDDICVGSEAGSVKSQKSSKTVISRRSSHELKKRVASQCKLQEEINQVLEQMYNTEDLDEARSNVHTMLQEKSTLPLEPLPLTHCQHCTDKMHASQSSQKNGTTELGKNDLAESTNDTLTISVDDVVNSKVINPMIRKLQRMYLNNLKEEMSLMEDLEHLPHKVNEVYKAAIFKQKE